MQNRTDYAGLPIRDRLRQTAGQYRRALEMAAAAAGGAVFAGAHILGGIAPFGVALAAAVPEGLFLPALFGALFGYLWFPAPGSAMEYAAAILLLCSVLCWVLARRITGPIEDISEAARRLGYHLEVGEVC